MKRTPEIRLKGFEGEWKESVLQDKLSDDIKTNTLARAFLSDSSGEVLNVHYGDVLIKYGSLLNATEDKIPHITGSTAKDYSDYLQDGDIIFADTAEDETAGKCVEITNVGDKKIVSGLHTIACRPKEQFGEGYLGYYLNSPKYHDQLLPLLQGIKVFSLNKSQLEQTTLFTPQSVSEQQSIGSFFFSFDRLISEHQQRLENLRRVKKSMLQKMFPQQGQTVPEIRFKGFEGEWIITKLKEISQKSTEKNSDLKYKVTLTNSAKFGIVDQLDFFDNKISKGDHIRNYYVVHDRDFVYNPRISDFAPVGPINQNLLGYTGVMSPLYYVFRVHDIEEGYLRYFFKTKLWHNFMRDNGNSGARHDRFSISDEMFGAMPIVHPSDIKEQQQLASFFTSLDNLINEEVKYIDQLNRVKRTLLQKMFV